MKIALVAATLLAASLSQAPQAAILGPKVLVVGANAQGAVRATWSCSGFGGPPVVDVHLDKCRIRDLTVTPTGAGSATFSFTLEYDAGTTLPGELWIFVTAGTGHKGDGFERLRVDVRRSN